MARIFEAREIQRDGKRTGLFHMTVASDEEGWCHPVGPCADGCPGHPTKKEALDHYREGRLVTDLRLDGFLKDCQRRCLECGEWTQKAGYFTGEFFQEFPLCDTHLNRDTVRKHYIANDRL